MTDVMKEFISAFEELGAPESVIRTLTSAVKSDEDVYTISREIMRISVKDGNKEAKSA